MGAAGRQENPAVKAVAHQGENELQVRLVEVILDRYMVLLEEHLAVPQEEAVMGRVVEEGKRVGYRIS